MRPQGAADAQQVDIPVPLFIRLSISGDKEGYAGVVLDVHVKACRLDGCKVRHLYG